jgi:hypothetical protein
MIIGYGMKEMAETKPWHSLYFEHFAYSSEEHPMFVQWKTNYVARRVKTTVPKHAVKRPQPTPEKCGSILPIGVPSSSRTICDASALGSRRDKREGLLANRLICCLPPACVVSGNEIEPSLCWLRKQADIAKACGRCERRRTSRKQVQTHESQAHTPPLRLHVFNQSRLVQIR